MVEEIEHIRQIFFFSHFPDRFGFYSLDIFCRVQDFRDFLFCHNNYAVIIPEDGVAYLKVDKKALDRDALLDYSIEQSQ